MAQQPLYQQIADDLRHQIESGSLGRGSQLPTELALREQYSASRNTVRDAIKLLVGQGLLETRAGQGTFVTPKIDPFVTVLTADRQSAGVGDGVSYLSDVTARDRKPFLSQPRVEVVAPGDAITARLRVPPGTTLVRRYQERFIDQIPWSLQTSYYSRELASRASRLMEPTDITEGTVAYLKATLGLTQVGYRDWITARNPNGNEASFFGITRDSTVFAVFRTAFDQDRKPMRVTVTVYPADRNQFIVNVGDDLPEPEYDVPASTAAPDGDMTG